MSGSGYNYQFPGQFNNGPGAATLFTYAQQVRRLVGDPTFKLLQEQDLYFYINAARRETAMRSESIRYLPPTAGSITSYSIVAAGSGLTAPTISISPPDYPPGTPSNPNGLQATATATIAGGSLSAVNPVVDGAGYFNPTVSVVSATGGGATVAPVLSPINVTAAGQEAYPFALVPLPTGLGSIHMVRGVAIIYANYRYTLPQYAWSEYQAAIRQYPFQYQYVPTMCCQFGQGTSGALYMYPLPSQVYQMEWDCCCLPSDLTTNASPEALPSPWVDAVPYFAAYTAYLTLQNHNAARAMKTLFDEFLHRYRVYVEPGRRTNPYGRY